MRTIIDVFTLVAIGAGIAAVIMTPMAIRQVANELRAIHETMKHQTTNSKP